ncbi:F1F0 ATPase subunit 2 [Hymenobacter sp. UYAg731]
MTEPTHLALALVAGLALGILFYYGLWLTVRATLTARHPALWVLGSFLGRVGGAVTGLYHVGRGDWRTLLGGLLGFVAARYLVAHFTRPAAPAGVPLSKPISHDA